MEQCDKDRAVAVKWALPRRVFPVAGLWIVLAILLALVGALSATVRLLTEFELYDDEGSLLVSLAHYINEGHLYTLTFSEYGPFYFYAQGIFFQLLHLPITHDAGRLVTLVYWGASSLLATFFLYRFSKSTVLACAAGLCVMLAGRVLIREPDHPQQVVLLLYMIAACLSVPLLFGRNYIRFFLLGCVGAALVFTKVNVGVFYMAGLAHALACVLPSGRIRSIGIGLMLIYAATAPWLLMHDHFNDGVGGYCLLATVCGFVTFAFGALVRPHHPLPIRAALYSGVGLLVGIVAIIAATSLQGMSVGSLIWGVLLNPLRHPDVVFFPLNIGGLELLAALILTTGVIGVRSFGRALAKLRWLDALRCIVGIGSILLLPWRYPVQWVMPLLPLTLIPASQWERDTDALFSRLFVTYLAVTQFLEPYPVAGSQVGIAAVPLILWAFLCIGDGIAGLWAPSSGGIEDAAKGLRWDVIIGGAILIFYAGVSIAASAHREFPPNSTRLKGAEWLHLPEKEATQFEAIARSVRRNCTILFTMPGMASFNLWSGIPTPNGWNLGGWMKGISSDRQAEILTIMKANPQACAILNPLIVQFWLRDNDEVARVAALPLAHYVMVEMPEKAKFGEYEIHVHPNRSLPWLPASDQYGQCLRLPVLVNFDERRERPNSFICRSEHGNTRSPC
jgi:hypothetical protein